MALSNKDQTRIRDYLLGHLNEEEQEKIEKRLMIEDDLFEELEISKGELIEEYRSGELAETEQSWFEQHYLLSAEGRRRHTFAIALDNVKPNPARVTLFERVAEFFKRQRQPFAVAAATAAVVVVAIVATNVWFLPSPTQLAIGPTLTSSVTNRGDGVPPARVTLPAGANALKIKLLLPKPQPPRVQYRAELDNRTELIPVTVAEYDADSVSVVIPVGQLQRGEYALRLVRITDAGEETTVPGDYRFNVE